LSKIVPAVTDVCWLGCAAAAQKVLGQVVADGPLIEDDSQAVSPLVFL